MTFEWPTALWGLLLIPAAIAAYLLAQRRRVRYAVRFTNLDLLANLVHRAPGWRRHVPAALYLTALGALVLSLARPQAVVLVPKEQATVVLVMDASGSMNATDVDPSRLVAAKRAAQSFVDQLPASFRVGVVSFAASAQTLIEPTDDRAAIRRALELVGANGGTAMGDGIERALDVRRALEGPPTPSATPNGIAPTPGRGTPAPATPNPGGSPSPATPSAAPESEEFPVAVVLLSDGASTAGATAPLDAAQHARELSVPVYTIAFGTAEGTVTVPSGPRGMLQTLRVPPDPETLRQIAEITGGTFFEAPTASDLRAVYSDLGSRIGFVEELQEVTFLFAGLGLVLMALGGGLSVLWFNRLP
jgi:Ca-activated chloride channel family protein